MINRSNINNILYAPLDPNLINGINLANGFDPSIMNNTFRTYVQDMNAYINSDAYLQSCIFYANYRDNNPIDISIYLATPETWVLGKRMREMLMASPFIENLTNKGYLEGCYPTNDNFVNYNKVVDGFLINDGEEEMLCSSWHGDDISLTYDEQLTIMEVWDNAKLMVNNGIDPTSFEN